MKILPVTGWIIGTALASALGLGCGATDGTSATASNQLVAPSSAVATPDGDHRGPPPHDPAQLAAFLDRDHDGRVEVTELSPRARERLATADADRDGVLTVPELTAHIDRQRTGRFARIDPDGDGAATAAEVGPERWAHLQAADADHDGRVTMSEIATARANGTLPPRGEGRFGGHLHGPPDPARLIERFDRNGNGTLEMSELPSRLAARLALADANHDGVLSVAELTAHVAQYAPGPDGPPPPDGPGAPGQPPTRE